MIEVKNIHKSFGDKTVIQDVSAVMKAGQCNLIIGSQRQRQNRINEMHGGFV